MMLLICCLSILLLQTIANPDCECGNDSLVKYNSDGLPKQLPWAVLVKIGKHQYCDGVILTRFKIATWNCKIDPKVPFKKVAIYTDRQTVVKNYYINLPEFATRKIAQPIWIKIDGFDVLVLEKPLKVSSKKAPICIAKSIAAINSPEKVFYRFEKVTLKRSDKPLYGDFSAYATINKLRIAREMNGPDAHAITYKSRSDGKWYFAGIEKGNELVRQTAKLAKETFLC